MGTRFEIFVSAGRDSRAIAEVAVEIVERAHRELSRFEPGGAVWRINRSPGERVPIDAELSGLLKRCAGYADASGGAFSIVRRGAAFVPMSTGLAVTADGRQAGLVEAGTEIDLGGVAKGYAFDLVREAFEEYAFDGAFLHGGASTIVGLGVKAGAKAGAKPGTKAGGEGPTPWMVEIDLGDGSPAPTVRLADRAMSVSSQHGDRPGHLVDPRTGKTAGGVGVAACVGESAEETDAWATALAVLGERPASMPQRLTSVVRSDAKAEAGGGEAGWAVEGPDRDSVGLPGI